SEPEPPESRVVGIYRPVGNTVTVQQVETEEEYDEQYQASFRRGVQLLAASQKKDPLE
ncbi:transposase, partial [Salmonella enterica subsp. enterica serovar Oranienburg]|nr:transposase [Salmonella enterica subsp. enterica serovar Oranienburg]